MWEQNLIDIDKNATSKPCISLLTYIIFVTIYVPEVDDLSPVILEFVPHKEVYGIAWYMQITSTRLFKS